MAERRVLVVDDEVVVRLLAERMFARSGDNATIVESASEAVEALRADDFDIVITDIRMPGGGGRSVAEAARQAGIPVVFITGYADSGDVQEFLEDGVPVVRKPFTPEQLLGAIEDVLGR